MKVAVIGGGPAGMMAAIKAAESGAEVTLFERNKNLGRKLLITGNRRCNLTNNKDSSELVKLINNGKFLYSSFANYDVNSIIKFFADNDLQLQEESDNKMYPVSNKSSDVLSTLEKVLIERNVSVSYNSLITSIELKDGLIESIVVNDKKEAFDHVIIATGGISFPNLGSDGLIHETLKNNNIKLTKLYPCEAALLSKDTFIRKADLAGISLSDVKISLYNNKKKLKHSSEGDLLFTHKGISGPVSLKVSEHVYKLLEKENNVNIQINLINSISQEDFIKVLKDNQNEKLINILKKYLVTRLAEFILNAIDLDKNIKVTEVSNAKLEDLYTMLFRFSMNITGVDNIKRAFVTGGGVSLKEIDSKTFKHKEIKNLSFAGEVLDLHGPIGGYNITIALITGMMAGSNIY